MTVKELKIELSKFPGETEVFIPSANGDYVYGIVNSVYLRDVYEWDDTLGIERPTIGVIIDEQ